MENTLPRNGSNSTFITNITIEESYPLELYTHTTDLVISEGLFIYDEIKSIYKTTIEQAEQLCEINKIWIYDFYKLLVSYLPNRTRPETLRWFNKVLNNYNNSWDYTCSINTLIKEDLIEVMDFICNICWILNRYKQLLIENTELFIQNLKKEESSTNSIINFKEKFICKFIYSHLNGYDETSSYYYNYEINKLLNTQIGIFVYQQIFSKAQNALCIDIMIFIKNKLNITKTVAKYINYGEVNYEDFEKILSYNIYKNNTSFLKKYNYMFRCTTVEKLDKQYRHTNILIDYIDSSIKSGNINLFKWVMGNPNFWNYIDKNETKCIMNYFKINEKKYIIDSFYKTLLNLFDTKNSKQHELCYVLFDVNQKEPYNLVYENIINDDIIKKLSKTLCDLSYEDNNPSIDINLEILKRIFSTQTHFSLKILNEMSRILKKCQIKEKIYNVGIEAGLILINTKTIQYYPRIKWTRQTFKNLHPRFKNSIITFMTILSIISKRTNLNNLKKPIISKWNKLYLPDELIFSIIQMIHPGDYNPYRSNKCSPIKQIFGIKK
jgi:hypothetical protein